MIIGTQIIHKEYLDNSFDYARTLYPTVPDGTVIVADVLGKARGRQGRVWHVAGEQLLLTFILKPSFTHCSSLPALMMALSVGLEQTISRYGGVLKWPNDILINYKKVAGLLVESIMKGPRIEAILAGIGINITTTFEPSHPLASHATSLSSAMGKIVSKKKVLENLLVDLDTFYTFFCAQAYEKIYDEWKKRQYFLNKPIKVHIQTGTSLEGIFYDTMSNGDIIVKTDDTTYESIPFYSTREICVLQ
jgi:BirA family biotin operon repressor/biotin-[acetyl-CoA-carboxylase] ligase